MGDRYRWRGASRTVKMTRSRQHKAPIRESANRGFATRDLPCGKGLVMEQREFNGNKLECQHSMFFLDNRLYRWKKFVIFFWMSSWDKTPSTRTTNACIIGRDPCRVASTKRRKADDPSMGKDTTVGPRGPRTDGVSQECRETESRFQRRSSWSNARARRVLEETGRSPSA